MATYYVRNDGSNANTGTGPATGQAWQTIAYAFANMTLTTGTNYLYIAPGVYRESLTLSVTPTATNTLVISGDPTAAQFSGVTPDQVRLTGASNNSTIQSAVTRINLGTKSYVTIENLFVEHNAAGGGNRAIYSQGNFIYLQNNVIFSYYLGGSVGSAIQIDPASATGNTIFVQNNIIFGCAFGIAVTVPPASSGVTGIVVRNNRIATNGSTNGYGIYIGASSGTNIASVTVSNCVITQSPTYAIRVENGNTTDKHIIQNNIIALGSVGISSVTSNQVTQRNNIILMGTALQNVATDVTTIESDYLGVDIGQALLQGFNQLAPFGTSYNSRNTAFGTATSAPTTDLYGIAWTGATPDVGVATYRTTGGVGIYRPTDRNASAITIAPASTSQSIELYLGATGLTATTAGLSARYNRTRTASVDIPLVARTIGLGWLSGGFAEVDATHMPGVYRLDLPNDALLAGADDVTVVVRGASGTNGAVMTIKLSSGGLTGAQTASAVWGASPSGYVDATTFGGVLMETNSVVNGIDTEVGDIPYNVWQQLKVNHTTPGTFGDYLDAKVSVVAETARIQLRQGPFLIRQNASEGLITEVNQFLSTVPNIEIVLIDSSGGSVSVSGSTLVMRVRNQAGTAVVNNITPTVAYADGGVIRWTPNLSWTALGVTTAGTYRIVVERTMGTVTTTFGPFLVQLSSG
jgi:hypothetical protein